MIFRRHGFEKLFFIINSIGLLILEILMLTTKSKYQKIMMITSGIFTVIMVILLVEFDIIYVLKNALDQQPDG